MGPLVPDVINNEMNLLLALLLGIALGFVLEQAGFSSSRKLTGLFYATDFTVLRVLFTAGVTAMAGIIALTQLGWLDPDLIYINPMFLHSAVVGGLIMGIGFVLGGYCPGTSFCGAAVGRVDAMAFVAGGIVGVFAFGEISPAVQEFYKAGSMGDLLVSNALGITSGQFAGALILLAVIAFVLTTKLEKRVSASGPAGQFPVAAHRLFGVALLLVAIVLFITPDRKARLEAKVMDEQYRKTNPVRTMDADELAVHLLDGDPKLQLIDVRDAAVFSKVALPDAVNLQKSALSGKEARTTIAAPRS